MCSTAKIDCVRKRSLHSCRRSWNALPDRNHVQCEFFDLLTWVRKKNTHRKRSMCETGVCLLLNWIQEGWTTVYWSKRRIAGSYNSHMRSLQLSCLTWIQYTDARSLSDTVHSLKSVIKRTNVVKERSLWHVWFKQLVHIFVQLSEGSQSKEEG